LGPPACRASPSRPQRAAPPLPPTAGRRAEPLGAIAAPPRPAMWLSCVKTCGKKGYVQSTPATCFLVLWAGLHIFALNTLYLIKGSVHIAEYNNFLSSAITDPYLVLLLLLATLLYLSLFNSNPGFLKPAANQASSPILQADERPPGHGRTMSYVSNLSGLSSQGAHRGARTAGRLPPLAPATASPRIGTTTSLPLATAPQGAAAARRAAWEAWRRCCGAPPAT
jgi:hypothetical protein